MHGYQVHPSVSLVVLTLEPAISPTGPAQWLMRQDCANAQDSTQAIGSRSDMVKSLIATKDARLKEGHTVIARVYGKDGGMDEHVQYNPDAERTGSKLPIPARAQEEVASFGRRCSTLTAPEGASEKGKAHAGKLRGRLQAMLDEVRARGGEKRIRTKAAKLIVEAEAASLRNGAASMRDMQVKELRALLAPYETAASGKTGKKDGKKAASDKPKTPWQSFVANRGAALRAAGVRGEDVMKQLGEEWAQLKAAGKVPATPKKETSKKEKDKKAAEKKEARQAKAAAKKEEAAAEKKRAKDAKAAAKKKEVAAAQKSAKEAKAATAGKKEPNPYQAFVAERTPILKAKGVPADQILKTIGAEWKAKKEKMNGKTNGNGNGNGNGKSASTTTAPAKTAPTSGAKNAAQSGGAGKRGAPAPLPNDPHIAQLAMFIGQKRGHAAT